MFCSECGKNLEPGALSCDGCGALTSEGIEDSGPDETGDDVLEDTGRSIPSPLSTTLRSKENYPIGSIGDSWNVIIKSPVDYIVVTLIMIAACWGISYLSDMLVTIPVNIISALFAQVGKAGVAFTLPLVIIGGMMNLAISTIILAPLSTGYASFLLKKVRGETPQYAEVFVGYTKFLAPSVATGLAVSVAAFLGFFLCIIPAIAVIFLTMFIYFVIADGGGDFKSVIARSIDLVIKKPWINLLFWILTGIIAIAGALACGIGTLFTMPLSYVAIALVYEYYRTISRDSSV